jgi:hypothetical protein
MFTVGKQVFALTVGLLVIPSAGRAQSEPALGPLSRIVPAQAVLVVYCPDVARLGDAVAMLQPLSQADDPVLRPVLKSFDEKGPLTIRLRGKDTGLTLHELAGALPDGAAVGWMPRLAGANVAFDSDNWVLVAPRRAGSDEALRRLWRQVAARVAPGSSVAQRQISGVAAEEVAWEDMKGKAQGDVARPKLEGFAGEPPPRVRAKDFNRGASFNRRAVSFALTDRYAVFAGSPAESLAPWLAAMTPKSAPAGPSRPPLEPLLARTANAGALVLAAHAKPSAWAPLETKPGRFGANPGHVLLSQARSVEAVVTRSGEELSLHATATFLPPPGWVARILATLVGGAALTNAPDRTTEIALSADYPRFWTSLQDVMAEGWPGIGVALDTLVRSLLGNPSDNMSRLLGTWGYELRFLAFREPPGREGEPMWALLIALRDPQAFARFEPGIVRIFQTFAFVPVRYDLEAGGRLVPRAEATATSASGFAPRVHVATTRSHFAAAGSALALQKALAAAANRSDRTSPPVTLAGQTPSAAAPDAGRAALVLHYEIADHPSARFTFGGNFRRTVRTPDGTFDLFSARPDASPNNAAAQNAAAQNAVARPEGRATTAPPPAAAAPSKPIATLTGSLTVESERSLLLQADLRLLGRPASPSESKPSPGKRDLRMQE